MVLLNQYRWRSVQPNPVLHGVARQRPVTAVAAGQRAFPPTASAAAGFRRRETLNTAIAAATSVAMTVAVGRAL